MSYAGICGTDDLQPHSDAYFISGNIAEALAHLAGEGSRIEGDVQVVRGLDDYTCRCGIVGRIGIDCQYSQRCNGCGYNDVG